ncbi:T9SS type A sorting domain-containing protein [Flavobacterium terrigena]|uniref:Por secretion system C-terminal sorting domain-containing protein n=1 Tax=Flavobacterium terrigena TaxID=402734 RepID=A0A1H6S0U0_9FLAO|nr:T9SS type A sorting domain-containing protein [Flavobacterium terrigena]SEI60306.1 Por secretion system C-terminal sorting domain-containing protein [Flavobacterium terrigena]
MKENYNSLGKNQRVLSSGTESNVSFMTSTDFKHTNVKRPNRFFSLVMLIMLLMAVWSSAQVTTNGGSGLAPTYTSLANAVAALNAATISSPVVITLTGNETAPAGGYRITAQGDATNTIIVEGSGSIITAALIGVNGNLYDAIFKLVGADYVTIRNFTMQENAGNTSLTTSATNRMTEWGVALLYLTTTNGAQNNTIQGNTISLNRLYRGSFGIYSNSTHAETTQGTNATATGATGSNTGLRILSNIISNVNMGIAVVGPTAAADHNQSLTIGGAGFGNTITNFGTDVPFGTPVNVSGSSYGVLVRNTANYTISHNTINSSDGGYIATTGAQFKAIYIPTFSNAPIGTLTQVIDHNTFSMRPASILTYVIHVETGTGSTDTSLSISNNNFTNSTFTTASSNAAFYCVVNRMGNLTENMNSNTFTNLNIDTTGTVVFFDHLVVRPANAICNVNNNSIVGTFTKSAGGALTFYLSGGVSPASVTETFSDNNFSNITLSGATAITGMRCIDGSAASGSTKTITNNIFSNIIGGTGATTLLFVNGSSNSTTSMVANNTITNITGGGAITGIESLFYGSQIFENNKINGLTSSGGAAVNGMNIGGSGTQKIFKNKIYNLENTNAAGSINGINLIGGTIDVQNNMIGDLRTPNADGFNPLNGINIAVTTGSVDVSHNTVMLSGGSTGTNFGTSAVSVTTGTITMRNNIFVNKTTSNGTGLAAAYRRSSTDLSTYAVASNNNLFFGSTIFTDGTNTDATLVAYKARVTPRDACSVTEDPTFLSTVGANANFLHIDTTIPTLIESWGAPIASITTDFDGDARNVATPDIGADEFNGTYIPPTTNSTTVSACDNYTWSVNGINYTTSGIYNYSADCHYTEILNLTINTTPVADAPANVTACDSYTLPVLTVGNYFTGAGGTGTALSAGNNITATQTIYVYSETGTTPNCTDENSFLVTINTTPVADAPANVTACDSYTLPALTVGNYFTAPGGTGTALSAGNNITATQTIYVYSETGTTPNCTDENSFTITITTSSSLPTEVVSVCDSYTWSANGSVYTTSGIYTSTTNCVTRTLDLTITSSSSLPTEVVSACDSYTWSANGTIYTTGGTYTSITNCLTRTLDLTINTATTPTGASTQVINGGVASDVTIEDIIVSGTGIIWYPTALDAANGTNPIAPSTQLVDGEDYFAVSVNGSCVSSAFQVTVTVVLGNASFDLAELNYYPNPVVETFNVRHNRNITSVQIFDVSGRMVKSIQPNTEMVEINLRELSTAMYIVKLQSEDNKQAEIKIFKK